MISETNFRLVEMLVSFILGIGFGLFISKLFHLYKPKQNGGEK